MSLVRPPSRERSNLSEIVCVRLSAQDVELLNRLVRLEDREASRIIREAIRAYAVSQLGPMAENV